MAGPNESGSGWGRRGVEPYPRVDIRLASSAGPRATLLQNLTLTRISLGFRGARFTSGGEGLISRTHIYPMTSGTYDW